MADNPRDMLAALLPPAVLTHGEIKIGVAITAQVQHVTPEAAQMAVDVAKAIHVEPKRVVMRYAVGGTALLSVAVAGVLWMAQAWHLDWRLALGAVLVVGVPFGIVTSSVLPKLLEQVTKGPSTP